MSLEQANVRLKAAVNRFRDEAGFQKGIGYSQEDTSEGRDVYALTIHVDGEGRPASYIGSVHNGPETEACDDPKVIERLHRRADKFEARATESVTNVTSFGDGSTDSVSTATLTPDWRVFESPQRDTVSDWGVFETDMNVGTYIYNDDDEPKTYHFGTFTSHRNSPGINEYSNNYHQKNGGMEHDYGAGLSVDLGRYAPASNQTGDYSCSGSISAGVSGADLTIGASYSPTNVSRFDESVLTEDRAVWDWDYNAKLLWDGATEDPDTFEPSSLGYTETTPEQDDLIVTIDRSADWFDPRAGSTSPDLSSATLIRYDSA